jgi:hypothetical protein
VLEKPSQFASFFESFCSFFSFKPTPQLPANLPKVP